MINSIKDTIAAISTPRGIGAIAVIRISGEKSRSIAETIFSPQHPKHALQKNMASLGHIISKNPDHTTLVLDQVILTFFPKPHSYTGEDIIEISCHGGLFIVQEILNLILLNGARLAEPGEFTLRAFLNGKMDLVQAESVNDLINSRTQSGLQLSFSQLSGVLSEDLLALKNSLRRNLALLEHELDFSEEDMQFVSRQNLQTDIELLNRQISSLIHSFTFGKIIREGARIVITGKPNVGKSSILNRLLKEERAIVSDIPGTTRDSLEESLNIDGILFVVVDTAGLRKTFDLVESEGVRRTEKLIETADIILHIIDSSNPDALNEPIQFAINNQQKLIIVLNKIDIYKTEIVNLLENICKEHPIVKVSAKSGSGFELLKRELLQTVLKEQNSTMEHVIANVRHRNALARCQDYLQNASNSLSQQLPPEFIALDIRGALDSLGEITGHVTSEDIINDIFSQFCIGK